MAFDLANAREGRYLYIEEAPWLAGYCVQICVRMDGRRWVIIGKGKRSVCLPRLYSVILGEKREENAKKDRLLANFPQKRNNTQSFFMRRAKLHINIVFSALLFTLFALFRNQKTKKTNKKMTHKNNKNI